MKIEFVESLMSLCPSIICKLKDSDDLAKQLLFSVGS